MGGGRVSKSRATTVAWNCPACPLEARSAVLVCQCKRQRLGVLRAHPRGGHTTAIVTPPVATMQRRHMQDRMPQAT
jgi:hypothetical protein